MVLLYSGSLLLILLFATAKASIDADATIFQSTYIPGGIQSGPDDRGSTWASHAVYSAMDNSVIFTGTTWGHFFQSLEQQVNEGLDSYGNSKHEDSRRSSTHAKCFMGAIALPGRTDEQQRYYSREVKEEDSMFWSRRQQVNSPSATSFHEMCNAAHFFPESKRLVLAGHLEERDEIAVTHNVMAEVTKQVGLLFDVEWNIAGDKSFKTVGGEVLDDHAIIYPIAIDSNSNSELDGVYVMFLQATHAATLIGASRTADTGRVFDSGEGYAMGVARFSISDQPVTETTSVKRFHQEWLATYDTNDTKSKVHLAGLVELSSGIVILAGSTDGEGGAYGTKSKDSSKLDGFVTKIDIRGRDPSQAHQESAVRLESGRDKNDWITGVCRDERGLNVYVVGTTEGVFPLSKSRPKGISAFIAKLNVATMEFAWIQQLGGKHRRSVVRGMACAVTSQGVWFAGVAEEGTLIDGVSDVSKPYGGKDVFVSKLLNSSGEIQIVRQMGTDKDDELATRGGLVVDTSGNAVVVGNTYGSFYRQRGREEKNSDVFVFTVSSLNGDIVPFTQPKTTFQIVRTVLGLMLAVVVLAGLGWLASSMIFQLSQGRPQQIDRSKVSIYLRKFHVENIDLRHSSSGGIHCSYLGRLAKGRSRPRKNNGREQAAQFETKGETDDLLDTSKGSLSDYNDVDDSQSTAYSDTMDNYNKRVGTVEQVTFGKLPIFTSYKKVCHTCAHVSSWSGTIHVAS